MTKSYLKFSLTEDKLLFFFNNENNQLICALAKLNNNSELIMTLGCKEQDKYTSIRNNSINVAKININNNNDIDAIIKSLNIVETFDIKQFYDFQFTIFIFHNKILNFK